MLEKQQNGRALSEQVVKHLHDLRCIVGQVVSNFRLLCHRLIAKDETKQRAAKWVSKEL
jgi:hypothetical protein